MVAKNEKAAVVGAAAWLKSDDRSSAKRPEHALVAATRDFRALAAGGDPADGEWERHGWSLRKRGGVGQAAVAVREARALHWVIIVRFASRHRRPVA
jgi:hypothetical protein